MLIFVDFKGGGLLIRQSVFTPAVLAHSSREYYFIFTFEIHDLLSH